MKCSDIKVAGVLKVWNIVSIPFNAFILQCLDDEKGIQPVDDQLSAQVLF